MAGSYSNLDFFMLKKSTHALRIIVFLQAGENGYSWDSNTSFQFTSSTYMSSDGSLFDSVVGTIKPSQMTNRPEYIKASLSAGEWATIYDSDYVPNFYTTYRAFIEPPTPGLYMTLKIGTKVNTLYYGSTMPTTSTFSITNKTLTAGTEGTNIRVSYGAPEFYPTWKYKFTTVVGNEKVFLGETTDSTGPYVTDVLPLDVFAYDMVNTTSKKYNISMDVYHTRPNGVEFQIYAVTSPGTNTTIKLPDSIHPTITSVTLSDKEGHRDFFGVYIGTKSILQASVEASGIYGSTITKVAYQIDNLSVSTTDPDNTTLIGQLDQSGSRTLKTTVTDSRGRTAVRNTTITVVPYVLPSVTATANRWDSSSGDYDDVAEDVKIEYTANIPSYNGINNQATIYIDKKESGTENYETTNAGHFYGPTLSQSYIFSSQSIDKRYEYRVRVQLDRFSSGDRAEATTSVGMGKPTLEFHSSGKGVGIGTVAPETGLNIGMQTFMQNNLAIGGLTTADVPTTILRLNSSDQVELNWTTGGLKGRVMKELWSGTWSSGNITVPELPYYNVFVVLTESNPVSPVPILAVRYNLSSTYDRIHGTNGQFEANNYMHLTQFQAAVKLSDPTILLPVMSNGIARDQIPANASFWNVKLRVAKIYGLL